MADDLSGILPEHILQFIHAAARRVSRHAPDLYDDLYQEGLLATLEHGGDLNNQMRRFVFSRMGDACKALRNPREKLSLDFNPGMENASTIDRLSGSVSYLTGPRTAPKDKNARWRHKMMSLNRCPRCGREIPKDAMHELNAAHYRHCLICRALRRVGFKRRNSRSNKKLRTSKYDEVIKILGLDRDDVVAAARRARMMSDARLLAVE